MKKINRKNLSLATAFSSITDQATCEATTELLHELYPNSTKLPVEIVMAGGDDLMLALPAQHGLWFAAKFAQLFEQKVQRYQLEQFGDLEKGFAPGGITTSVGVLLTHCHYPAMDMINIASDLLKNAKRKGTLEMQGRGPAAARIDFHVLHESAITNILSKREVEYGATYGNWKVRRTERPYSVDGILELLNLVHLCAKVVPKNKLKSLQASLFCDSIWESRFLAQRVRQQLHRSGVLQVHAELNKLFESDLSHYPYRKSKGALSSPFSDIAELLEFTDPLHNKADVPEIAECNHAS